MDARQADKPTKTSIEYAEVQLQQVLQFFVNAYKLPEGEVTSHEAFVDTANGKVLFRLFVTAPVDDATDDEDE